jgi:shikimate dehydrogenase
MASDGRALYGIVGYPARHSLSPVMHQAAFDGLGMKAEYRIFEVAPEKLGSFLSDEARHTLHGFNVTIPYKEQAVPFLDYASADVRLSCAVNTVKVRSSRLEGFNTDGQGFMNDLSEKGFYPGSAKVCVIGAGGASRAVCFAIAKSGPQKLAVFNRDRRKAEELVRRLAAQFPKIEFSYPESAEKLGIEDAQLLVNATSLGMHAGDPLPVEERFLHEGLLVYDLVYSPPETALLRAARKKGCRCANGLGMLLHQGMLSFEIWTGVKPPKDAMEQALRKSL